MVADVRHVSGNLGVDTVGGAHPTVVIIGQMVVRTGPVGGEAVVGYYLFHMDVLPFEEQFHEVK